MQTATNMIHSRQPAEGSRVRALIRFNSLMFHGVTAASLLETAAPLYAERLLRIAAFDPDMAVWVDTVWRQRRDACGRELRAYVEATWPEFDWSAAYEEFCDEYRQRPGRALAYANPALEAVARCTVESQAAVFYRAVANSADDPALRRLAGSAAGDHADCFERFRSYYERLARSRRAGFTATCRTVRETMRAVRDVDVAAAFQPLAANWYGTPTVTGLAYHDFLKRMAQLIRRHAELGCLERLLFSPWLRRAMPLQASRGGRREARQPLAVPLKKAA